jgi:hypothetical protein
MTTETAKTEVGTDKEPQDKGKTLVKTCPVCGDEFETKHHLQKYCDECRKLSKTAPRKEKEEPKTLLDRVEMIPPEMAYAFRVKNEEAIDSLDSDERDAVLKELMTKEADHNFSWIHAEFHEADELLWKIEVAAGRTSLIIKHGDKQIGLVMDDSYIQNINNDENKKDKIKEARKYLGL